MANLKTFGFKTKLFFVFLQWMENIITLLKRENFIRKGWLSCEPDSRYVL